MGQFDPIYGKNIHHFGTLHEFVPLTIVWEMMEPGRWYGARIHLSGTPGDLFNVRLTAAAANEPSNTSRIEYNSVRQHGCHERSTGLFVAPNQTRPPSPSPACRIFPNQAM